MDHGEPKVTKRNGDQGWWWDTEQTAKFGDVAAYRDVRGDYVYILGNPPKNFTGWPANSYVYQARVVAADAFDLSKYQYWWGRQQGWKRDVLSTFTAETAVMWGVGQGQLLYSNHFGYYIYIHLSKSPCDSKLETISPLYARRPYSPLHSRTHLSPAPLHPKRCRIR